MAATRSTTTRLLRTCTSSSSSSAFIKPCSLSHFTTCRRSQDASTSSTSTPIASTSTSEPPLATAARPSSTTQLPTPSPSTTTIPLRSTTTSNGSTLFSPSPQTQIQAIHQLLRPIGLDGELDDKLIRTALTMKSGLGRDDRHEEHAEKLAFLGRRILRLHYTVHLSTSLPSTSPLLHHYLSPNQYHTNLLETHELGATIGSLWSLSPLIKWRSVKDAKGRDSGLFKARGQAVEALIGAVYQQFGIVASEKLYKALIWPALAVGQALRNEVKE